MVSLTFETDADSRNIPYRIRAIEEANFRWDNSLDKELVDQLLKQNAPSLLMGYLRPIISQVTSSSKYGAYNIPFINFVPDNEQKQ